VAVELGPRVFDTLMARADTAGSRAAAAQGRRRRAVETARATAPPPAVAPLAALRRRVPWTQGELAAAAGVAVSTVGAVERGAYKRVRPRVIRALAAALGVAPAAVAEFRPSLGLPPAAPGPEAEPRLPD
jgi:DNA-binding XRE family transcriptional regulator